MKILTDKPFGLRDFNFVCMGIVSDSDKDYACLLQIDQGHLYIEEIHWGRGRNIHTATLHQIDNNKEWAAMFNFISQTTTIFSPRKVKPIIKCPYMYFYNSCKGYTKSKDFEQRKKKGIL